MPAMSSLSRTSSFSHAGTTIRRKAEGRACTASSKVVPGVRMENSAHWLATRLLWDGGSRKTGPPPTASKSCSVAGAHASRGGPGACAPRAPQRTNSSSCSTVKLVVTFSSLDLPAFHSPSGPLAALSSAVSTHHTTASLPACLPAGTSAVAKWSATRGLNVQSSRRVGSPWCCAKASHSHTEAWGGSSSAAYFLNDLSMGCSTCCTCSTLPRRSSVVTSRCSRSASPRKTCRGLNLPMLAL
mmetsp:Transcript_3240/g.8764  ORF Transcript_3240/g.8764 Transcript_3240/m.8764 type:complete len:242 (+) Transcript_3240:117-842(+)